MFCTFWLANALRATAAWHFWTSILTCKCASRHSGRPFFESEVPKLAPRCDVLYISTCKCASRHSHMLFLDIVELQKVLRTWGVLDIFTCKCASRHSGVPFFVSLLNSYLHTRRFSEPTFRTCGTTNHWKNTAIRDVPNICRMYIFFLVTLLACWSSSYLTSLVCFSTVHIVGS